MRLLKRNKDGSIAFTKDLPEAELPPYAILSHTWGLDEEEVTYEDITCGIGTSKPGVGAAKIRFCIEQTKQDELEYFWVDTCCIDKKNLSELDRSLRSMFRWYANAERCYVYLLGTVVQADSKEFRSHTWFRRGWTLQELIAPRIVEFFTQYGNSLGTRSSLEKQINEITHIPVAALRGKALVDFTVVERKQWQEGRETREPEDLVYSLLGLLQVSMPVLYGEGRALAWQRLETAIEEQRKGIQRADFSLPFSLPGVVETENFVARKNELEEIRANLASDGRRRCVVLHGLGGMGKTQLAIAYAMRHREDYSAIFWLDATSADSMKSSFSVIAKQILAKYPSAAGLSTASTNQLDEVVRGTCAWFDMDSNNRWLLICDNHDNPKLSGNEDSAAFDLREYIPNAHQGSIIVTTRSSELTLGHCLRLEKLENLEDGLEILKCSSGRSGLANGKHPSFTWKLADCVDDGAITLVRKLDGFPLALVTAGAYLSQTGITCKEYIEHFEQSWAELQRLSPVIMTYENRTLYSTWQISFEQIKRRDSTAAHLLCLWAYLDHRDLWFELLKSGKSKRSPEWFKGMVKSKLRFNAVVKVLCDHGLVNVNTGNELEIDSLGYSVHACVHAWMTAVLNEVQDSDLVELALHCIAGRLPEKFDPNRSLVQRRVLNHADRWSQLFNVADHSGMAWAYDRLGVLYRKQGKLFEAEQMYMQSLKIRKNLDGPDDAATLDTINDLGSVYRLQGRLREAEELFLRALKGEEKLSGEQCNYESVELLNTIESLGLLYSDQGKLDEAEAMLMRALRGLEKVLPTGHTYTLDCVNNLGVLYESEGKLAEAEKMYLRVLREKEEATGSKAYHDPASLSTVYNLGLLYHDRGRLVEAEQMHLQALAGREKTLGPHHHDTLKSVAGLCSLRLKQRRDDDAATLYTRLSQNYDRLNPSLQAEVDWLRDSLSDQRSTPVADIAAALSPDHFTKQEHGATSVSAAAVISVGAKEPPRRRGLQRLTAIFRRK